MPVQAVYMTMGITEEAVYLFTDITDTSLGRLCVFVITHQRL